MSVTTSQYEIISKNQICSVKTFFSWAWSTRHGKKFIGTSSILAWGKSRVLPSDPSFITKNNTNYFKTCVVIVWNRKLVKLKPYCCKSWIGDNSLIALNKIKYSTCLLIAFDLSTPSNPSSTLLVMLFQNFPKLPSQHFSRVQQQQSWKYSFTCWSILVNQL